MALPFTTAYTNSDDDFRKRVLAILEAQSYAISAALAMASRDASHVEALTHEQLRIRNTLSEMFPKNDRDKGYVDQVIGSIFEDARRINTHVFPWEKSEQSPE